MVHLIVMTEGSTAALLKAETLFTKHQGGWYRIESGVWLVATDVTASDWRDFLRVQTPGTKFLVAQLSGDWATMGLPPVGEWLKSARDSF